MAYSVVLVVWDPGTCRLLGAACGCCLVTCGLQLPVCLCTWFTAGWCHCSTGTGETSSHGRLSRPTVPTCSSMETPSSPDGTNVSWWHRTVVWLWGLFLVWFVWYDYFRTQTALTSTKCAQIPVFRRNRVTQSVGGMVLWSVWMVWFVWSHCRIQNEDK